MRRAAYLVALSALASARPAPASPNAFWTFGWSTGAGRAASGSADARQTTPETPSSIRPGDGAYVLRAERINAFGWFYRLGPARPRNAAARTRASKATKPE